MPGFTPFGTFITDMQVLPSGAILCTGVLNLPTGTVDAALFDGVNFQPLTPPVQSIRKLVLRANGSVAGLTFPVTGAPQQVVTWDGSTWTIVSDAPIRTRTVSEDAMGNLIIGGGYGPDEHSVQRWDGTQWQPVGSPLPPKIQSILTGKDGSVFVAGLFSEFEGVMANNIVRWDGDSYHPLGQGLGGEVRDIALADDGSIVVSGSFLTAGSTQATGIARWDGQSWSAVGTPPASFDPRSIAIAPNGDVYARANGVWRFAQGVWTQLNLPFSTGFLEDLAVLPTGELVLAGVFLGGPGFFSLAQVDTSGVAGPFPGSVAAGMTSARQALVTKNGDLIVGGPTADRWNGSTWTAIGNLVHLTELRNGDLLGAATAGPNPLLRLSGSTTTPVADVGGNVVNIAVAGDGDLLIGGPFETVEGEIRRGFARAANLCPATADSFGSGCSGSAGQVTLIRDTRPWIGTEYRATATGMATQSLALQAVGNAAPAVPLPVGASGCQLLVAPFVTDVASTSQGLATLALPLPNAPVLVGLNLRQQAIGIELDANGITQLTSSNALDLTIGSL